ncbi:MAG: FkbM family methyltransferase [Alphaproteobacteria bacterium]|nr:FkbM family methyltransferase [Alphaproteobacteria bacterium]
MIDATETLLKEIIDRLNNVEHRSASPGAVYLGEGKVLCRVIMPTNLQRDVLMIVDGKDRLLGPRMIMDGYHEKPATNFFLANVRSNSNCIDVGANIGYFTCILARLAWRGKVLSIEADPVMCEQLNGNIQINWVSNNARIINAGAAAEPGNITLYRRPNYSGNTGMSRHGYDDSEASKLAFTARTIALDSLLPDIDGRCDFLKIDIEGAEPLAFRGAKELLKQNPQIKIVFEWSPEQIRLCDCEPEELVEILRDAGLSPYRLADDGSTTACTWPEISRSDYDNFVAMSYS